MAWTPPVPPTGGTIALASWMTTYVINNLKAIGDPYTTYTPTYTGITAIGNATVIAKYWQAGKKVEGYVKVTMGSTTTFGAAGMSVSLPVAPLVQPNAVVGSVYMQDTSASAFSIGVAVTGTSGLTVGIINSTGVTVTNLVPWTWANTDILSFAFAYEAA